MYLLGEVFNMARSIGVDGWIMYTVRIGESNLEFGAILFNPRGTGLFGFSLLQCLIREGM